MSCSKNLFLLNKKVTACTAAVSSFGRLGRFGRLRRLGRFCFWYDRSKGRLVRRTARACQRSGRGSVIRLRSRRGGAAATSHRPVCALDVLATRLNNAPFDRQGRGDPRDTRVETARATRSSSEERCLPGLAQLRRGWISTRWRPPGRARSVIYVST